MSKNSAIKVLSLAFALSCLKGASLGATNTPIADSKQLLSTLMSCDASNLVEFVNSQGTNLAVRQQFDGMIEYLNCLDIDQLLELVEKGFSNGWPAHIVSGLFSKAFMNAWGTRPPDANQLCSRLDDLALHPGCKLFIIQGAQRKWADTWDVKDYLCFLRRASRFASDTNVNYSLRSPVVDDFLRSTGKRLTGDISETAQNEILTTLGELTLSLITSVNHNTDAAYAITRDSLRGFRLLTGNTTHRTDLAERARDEMVRLLKSAESPGVVVREILKAQDAIDLSSVLTLEDLTSLKADQRLNDAEARTMLDNLSQRMSGR